MNGIRNKLGGLIAMQEGEWRTEAEMCSGVSRRPVLRNSRRYSKSVPLLSMKNLPWSSLVEGIGEETSDDRKLAPRAKRVASVVSNILPPTLNFTNLSSDCRIKISLENVSDEFTPSSALPRSEGG